MIIISIMFLLYQDRWMPGDWSWSDSLCRMAYSIQYTAESMGITNRSFIISERAFTLFTYLKINNYDVWIKNFYVRTDEHTLDCLKLHLKPKITSPQLIHPKGLRLRNRSVPPWQCSFFRNYKPVGL